MAAGANGSALLTHSQQQLQGQGHKPRTHKPRVRLCGASHLVTCTGEPTLTAPEPTTPLRTSPSLHGQSEPLHTPLAQEPLREVQLRLAQHLHSAQLSVSLPGGLALLCSQIRQLPLLHPPTFSSLSSLILHPQVSPTFPPEYVGRCHLPCTYSPSSSWTHSSSTQLTQGSPLFTLQWLPQPSGDSASSSWRGSQDLP